MNGRDRSARVGLLAMVIAGCDPVASRTPEMTRVRVPSATAAKPAEAAIVWVPEKGAESEIRSVWIERNGSNAAVVTERKGRVFVGRSELWALEARAVKLTTPKCDEPNSDCSPELELSEPYLKSLATGKVQTPPWHAEFGPTTDCNESVDVSIEGAVGTIVFARTSLSKMACGGACFGHGQRLATFGVDTGQPVRVEFPPAIVGALRARAHEDWPNAADFCNYPPYRAAARYNPRGELEGLYELGGDQDGMCGPSQCPNAVEHAAEPPAELRQWAKLPTWVAGYLASTHAEEAFMIPAERAAAAKAELGH